MMLAARDILMREQGWFGCEFVRMAFELVCRNLDTDGARLRAVQLTVNAATPRRSTAHAKLANVPPRHYKPG
jgi:hypothetical protein